MPTYEYECKSCDHVFEAFQSMKDAPLDTCPECGGKLRRLINGGTGVIFKGSGFYVTDKSRGEKAAAPKKEPEGGTAAKKPDAPAAPATGTPATAGTAPVGPAPAPAT